VSRYLFRLSYGPVQPFIAASRRTRDLRNGSLLLLEIGAWMLNEVKTAGRDIRWIFPHEPSAAAANVLQFVADTDDPAGLVAACRSAAVRGFRECYERQNLPLPDLATRQFDAYLQFFAAWEPLASDADYPAAHRAVGARLAARKALRAFPAAPSHQGEKANGRIHYPPKSPLLPSLDCVLPLEGIEVAESAQDRYLVDPYEFLDGISLLKRRTKSDTPFPSTLTVCAYGAVSQLGDEDAMARFKALVAEAQRSDWDEDPGELLFGKSADEEDAGEQANDQRKRTAHPAPQDKKDEIEAIRRRLRDAGIGLRAYYAVLHADGDGMGRRLSQLQTPDEHREFSRTLAECFADRVPEIVGRHHGATVYAGGDDVLALLPAETAIDCAVELNRLFREAVPGCTLSVGLAIVHTHHSLQHAIGLSRELEARAKSREGKNALAIGAYPRNGGETVVCLGFDEQDESPLSLSHFREHLAKWKEGIPRSLPYDLRDEASRLPRHPLPWVVPGAYQRIVQRKRLQGAAKLPPGWVKDRDSLQRYAEHLAVAHFLTRGGSR